VAFSRISLLLSIALVSHNWIEGDGHLETNQVPQGERKREHTNKLKQTCILETVEETYTCGMIFNAEIQFGREQPSGLSLNLVHLTQLKSKRNNTKPRETTVP